MKCIDFVMTLEWGIMIQCYQGNNYIFKWLYLDQQFWTAVLIRAMKKRHSRLDLVTYDLEHEVGLVIHGLILLLT